MIEDPKALGYLDQIRRASLDGENFLRGMSKDDFLVDRRTQQAVVMSLMIMGEAAAKLIERYPEFVKANDDIPWISMRGMRNRIAHGYFGIDMSIVWDTAIERLPLIAESLTRLSERK